MKQPLIYLAHPVSPDSAKSFEDNVTDTKLIYRALLDAGLHVVCPWLPIIELLDDTKPEHRATGLAIDTEVAARCDIVLLTGHKFSSGMMAEAQAYLDATNPADREVVDMVGVVHDYVVTRMLDVAKFWGRNKT